MRPINVTFPDGSPMQTRHKITVQIAVLKMAKRLKANASRVVLASAVVAIVAAEPERFARPVAFAMGVAVVAIAALAWLAGRICKQQQSRGESNAESI